MCVRHQYFSSCKLPYSLLLPNLPDGFAEKSLGTNFLKWRIFTAENGLIKAKNSMVEYVVSPLRKLCILM